jgi:methyl-accepting chemotaxis protein
MDQGTQQNAAMVEESNAQAATLAGEAEALAALLQQFRTRGTGQASRRPPARIPQPASQASKPVASPARALGNRVAKSFATGGSAKAAASSDWEEF